MPCDLPCVSYMALYIISVHIINTNSRTSTHWKLNVESGKVQSAVAAGGGDPLDGPETDPLMSILTSRINMENGHWRLDANPVNDNCQDKKDSTDKPQQNNESNRSADSDHQEHKQRDNHPAQPKSTGTTKKNVQASSKPTATTSKPSEPKKKYVLDCGRAVNNTQFDHLRGVAERENHPLVPEPEVALIFKKKGAKPGSQEVDMNDLERKLKKARKEKPKSPQVYNQIGNFYRIRGNTQMSIECFRKALYFSPNNSDVLLNLARVLFNLQYLDDAIELTQQSLLTQSPDQNSWLQHFTLGEILKAYGRYPEASLHFRHTLDLNPGFHPAIAHLREMEISPDGTVTYYTLFIILFLVLGVLCGILTSVDGNFEDLGETMKTQRHFNRAMAMRSMKLGINPKVIRMRKQGYNC